MLIIYGVLIKYKYWMILNIEDMYSGNKLVYFLLVIIDLFWYDVLFGLWLYRCFIFGCDGIGNVNSKLVYYRT